MAGAAPGCATRGAFLLDRRCAPPQSTGARSQEPSPGFFSLLLPPSVLLVTPVGPHPVFAFLFRLCSACVVCLGSLLTYFPFSSRPSRHLPWPRPLLPGSPHPHHVIFSSAPLHLISFQPPHRLCFIHQLFNIEKEKKGGSTPKKAQTKTNLECVSKCCVLLVACASLWPAACSPALPVCSVSCPPARLALPANDTEFSAWVFGDGL